MTLQTNRYGQVTPTCILSNGCAISVPFYVSLTADQSKQMLNAFRTVKQRQLLEMGWENTRHDSSSGISVVTATKPPTTAIEEELGMDEEALRYVLFGRNGIQERLIFKLQRLTGVYFFNREQVENTYKAWLDTFYTEDLGNTNTPTRSKKISVAKA